MTPFRFTLVSDGTSDANLIPIIQWTLRETGGWPLSEGQQADFWRLRKRPAFLAERICAAAEYYPCEALFIHRDAEGESREKRLQEMQEAMEAAQASGFKLPAVALVTVRMLEAWFLFDPLAIRFAAGNPHGETPLHLPSLSKTESEPDPKSALHQALLAASELTGRRRKKFDVHAAFWRITNHIEDFSPLRKLSAFRAFEETVKALCQDKCKPGFYS